MGTTGAVRLVPIDSPQFCLTPRSAAGSTESGVVLILHTREVAEAKEAHLPI